MERSENLNSKSHILHSRQLKQLSIGINSFNFSKRIAAKYSIFRKSANLSALIFLRFFGIRGVNKGGWGGLQFLASFVSRRLMNIQPGMILNTQKVNKSASNVKINLSLFPEGLAAAPNAFGAAATSDYNASYVILDKRMLPGIPLLTQSTQNLQNVIKSSGTSSAVTAMERSPRNNLSVSEQTQQSPHFHISNPLPRLFLKGSPSLNPSHQGREIIRESLVKGWKVVSPLMEAELFKFPLPLWERARGISPGVILNTQKAANPTMKRDTNIFSVINYPEAGNNSKDVNYRRQEKTSAFFNNIPRYRLPKRSNSLMHESEIDSLPLAMAKRNVAMIENITNKTIELILRKPITQNTNTVSESKDYQHKEKIISPKMTENLTKDLKERSAHEINMIADKVYKIIEKKITIEKDRKGLR